MSSRTLRQVVNQPYELADSCDGAIASTEPEKKTMISFSAMYDGNVSVFEKQ